MPDEQTTEMMVAIGRIEQQLIDIKESQVSITKSIEREHESLYNLTQKFHAHLIADSERPCKKHEDFFTKEWDEHKKDYVATKRFMWVVIGGGAVVLFLINLGIELLKVTRVHQP